MIERAAIQFAESLAFKNPLNPVNPCDETIMTTQNEMQTEAAIQAKGLNAPRLTPADIDAAIFGEDFYVFPGTTVTICCLRLKNGFTATGESACVSPENFDAEIGRNVAREDARRKIWALEGYLLRERLSA